MKKSVIFVAMTAVLFTTACGKKIPRDLFTDYLDLREKNSLVRRALTAPSYKQVDNKIQDEDTNVQLATYGDAIIKFCYCSILWDENPENLTEAKKPLEQNATFVTKVAKHYDLLEYMYFHKSNKDIPQNYDEYTENHKYIADAVEGMIGAIYLDNKNNLKEITKLLDSWRKF